MDKKLKNIIKVSEEYKIVVDMHNKIRTNIYKQIKFDFFTLRPKKYSVTGWHSFPFLFIQIFPNVPIQYYRLIALSGVLYLDYLYTNEMIIDENISDPIVIILSHSFLKKSLDILHEVFNAKSEFWKYYKKYFNEYSRAILLEKIKHKGLVIDYSFNEFKLIAKGKSAMSKCAVAALGVLSKREELIPHLGSFLDYYNISLQAVDDLEDWKEDYLSSDYSYLLTRLIYKHEWAKNVTDGNKPDVELVGKALYFSGLANKNLELAQKYIEKANSYIKNFECPLLLTHTMGLKAEYYGLWSDLVHIQKQERIKRELKFNKYLFTDLREYHLLKKSSTGVKKKSEISLAIQKAKTFLEKSQSSEGFWSDYEIVKNRGKSPKQSTEWVTGYVGYILSKLDPSISFLQKAKKWVITNQHPEGGWGYNKEVPVDADSTFNCLLFLKEMNVENSEIKSSIDTALKFWNPQNGGFRTYINVDSIRNYTSLSEESSFEGWCSSHLCVTAVAAQGLMRLGFKVDSSPLRETLDFILSQQWKEGFWESYWWNGKTYSTCQAVRALMMSKYGENNSFLKTTAQWLIKTQSPDGSWRNSLSQLGDPFVTSLAGGALLEIFRKSSDEIDKGIIWLLNNQFPNGSWISLPKLKIPPPFDKEPWKSKEMRERNPLYGSVYRDQNRVFTTGTVLLTLLNYRKIAGNKLLYLVQSRGNNDIQ